MTMVRPSRSAGYDRDARDHDFDDRGGGRRTPGSLPIRAAELAMRNPLATGGIAVSLAMVVVTITNAVANQPVRHPHPLFDTRSTAQVDTRPAPPVAVHPTAVTPPTVAPTRADPPTGSTGSTGPIVLPRPKPVSAVDEGVVRDLQTVLAERGFYSGPIDGVVGAATAEAIRAGERRLGSTATGEASDLLLAALRAAPNIVAQVAPPVSAAPKQVVAQTRQPAAAAPPPARPPVAQAVAQPAPQVAAQAVSPPPTPPMRVAAADAVAYPVGREEVEAAEVDVPVFTGSIRRAAREPLAQGGDDKLQKLQRALIAAGYGPLKADGRWDERSTSAVRRYEADRGWPVTGRPSEKLVWDLMPKAARATR